MKCCAAQAFDLELGECKTAIAQACIYAVHCVRHLRNVRLTHIHHLNFAAEVGLKLPAQAHWCIGYNNIHETELQQGDTLVRALHVLAVLGVHRTVLNRRGSSVSHSWSSRSTGRVN